MEEKMNFLVEKEYAVCYIYLVHSIGGYLMYEKRKKVPYHLATVLELR